MFGRVRLSAAALGNVATLSVMLFLLCCSDKPLPRKSASLASRIELATGNVTIKQPEDQSWTRAIAGEVLRHGSAVKVGPGDRSLIRLGDGSSVFLRHGTEVRLPASGLQLVSGEVWVDAPPQEKEPARYAAGDVTVSASNAGLDIKHTKGAIEIYVARGLAVVSSPGGRSEVQAGERALIKGKQPPKILPVAFWEDWTGGMPDRNLAPGMGGAASGRIYAINRARRGAPPQELEIRSQQVRVTIRDGVARTTVDQRFFNPSSAQVEGYYWFTVPEGAAVDRFALDVNGVMVDGEVVERKQAKAAYEASIRQAVDPALLEWIDGRTFRARIFPIPAAGERRVVLSYLELLPTVDGRTHYVYPMGGGDARIQEFALEVDLGKQGEKMQLAASADARVELKGRKVSVRRSGYKPQGDFLLELTSKADKPLRGVRVKSARNEAAYVMVRYTPDLKWEQMKKVAGHVVVVVDTSAGGDMATRQLRTDVAEAILRALSTSDKFALVAVDLTPRVLYPSEGMVAADEAGIGKALERLSSVHSGGATDLGALFDVALKRVHGSMQPAVVYIGDGRATVGEMQGDELAQRVTRSFAGSRARLFTIATGGNSNHALLSRLARIGGGRSFRVDVFEQSVQEALRFVGHLKTPTITDLKMDLGAGMDQLFSSATGKVSRGQEVVVLARTHHSLPKRVKVSGKLGGEPFAKEYDLSMLSGGRYSYVPRLWARRYLTHLMGADRQRNRGTILRLGLDYALMTPFSSFLVLESDAAYQRFGIQRRQRDPLWGYVPQAALEAAAAVPLSLFGCSYKRKASEAPAVEDEHQSLASEPPPPPASRPPMRPKPAMEAKKVSMGDVEHERSSVAMKSSPAPGFGGKDGRGYAAKRRLHKKPMKEEALADKSQPADQSAEGLDHKDMDAIVHVLRTCSDAARRSLAHRRAIWQQQLARTSSVSGWLAMYRRAGAACELPHWRDRKELLDLIQQRVRSAGEVRALLRGLGRTKARSFIRRSLLRRAVTPAMAAAFSDSVNWAMADEALSRVTDPQKRVEELRRICQQNPRSVGCGVRLIRALVGADKAAEALAVALKLRVDGMATPLLMQQIGDLLHGEGRPVEAKRSYSEIVEFAPGDPAARRLLGDIYLRHGWYPESYRQYKTISRLAPDDVQAVLRLDASAAGSGRVDEALRTERKVAAGDGEPGPSDPRRWARLWSAARIARLMLGRGQKGESVHQSMERSLKRLQVLTSPGVLFLLTWEDLEARLVLSTGDDLPRTDRVNAGSTGLMALMTRPVTGRQITLRVSRGGGPAGRAVPFQVAVIRYDGKGIKVTNTRGKLAGKEIPLTITLP